MAELDLTAFRNYLEPRFWPKVIITDSCWWWTAATTAYGYGVIASRGYRSRQMGAHHAGWFLLTGELPPVGIDLCHQCDNPRCVNPDHLFQASRRLNLLDAFAKGRLTFCHPRFGQNNGSSKLTWAHVRDIRRSHAAGESAKSITHRMGMGRSAIGSILRGETWQEIQSVSTQNGPDRG